MIRKLGLGLLLLAPWNLSGCLWLSGVTASLLSSSGGGSGGGPRLENLSIALLSSGTAGLGEVVCDQPFESRAPEWHEGAVPFEVTLGGQETERFNLKLFFRDAQGETPVEARLQTGDGGSFPPHHGYRLGPGTHKFLWDSSAVIPDANRIWLVARSRGALGVTGDSFWVDNRAPGVLGAVTVVASPDGTQHDDVQLSLSGFDAEEIAIRLLILGEDTGNPRVVELAAGNDFKFSKPTATLTWHSGVSLPDDHALVRLEVAPSNGIKRGSPVATECFYLDNRGPQVLTVDPSVAPIDARFTLQVNGQGFRWPGVASSQTLLSLTRPGDNPGDWIAPTSTSPAQPLHDLEEPRAGCQCARDLGPDLRGPGLLSFIVGAEELRQFGLAEHAGEVSVHLKNPNGKVGKLDGWLYLGSSRFSPIGPYSLLDGTPRQVVLGDFAPDAASAREGASPGAPLSSVPRARRIDAAIIYEDRSFVTVLGGDGSGFFPERWVVPLVTPGARPLALLCLPATAPDESDTLLIATETTLERIFSETGRHGDFAGEVLVEGLTPEPDARDLVSGDFDGDQKLDLAVSSHLRSRVEVFRGEGDGVTWSWWGDLQVSLPRSLVAANFDADPENRADLVVLGDREGTDTLFLHLNEGAQLRREASATLAIPDGAVAVESSPDARFNAQDPYPDVVVVRTVGVARILIKPPGVEKEPPVWSFETFPRPTGTYSDVPRAAALVHLPGGARRDGEPLWDLAAVDQAAFLSFAYVEGNGVQRDENSSYPLAGPGRFLAVGDVTGDVVEDIVVATETPSALQVFLGRSTWEPLRALCDGLLEKDEGLLKEAELVERDECEATLAELRSDPYVIPAGRFEGENVSRGPQRAAKLTTGVHGGRPFLAVATRLRNEAHIFWLEPGSTRVKSVERHSDLGSQLSGIATADLDLDGNDEVVVSSEAEDQVRIFDPVEGVARLVLDLGDLRRNHPGILPAELRSLAPTIQLSTSRLETGQLNGEGPPEIFFGLFADTPARLPRDFVVVLVDPGTPQQELHFYRTLDDPRQCSLANLNGDRAPDLLIACEGSGKNQQDQDESTGNSVHILFGDPGQSKGRLFFDESSDPGDRRGWIAPLQLPAFPRGTEGEVEFVLSDSKPDRTSPSGLTEAQRIFASTSPLVILYALHRGAPLPGEPCANDLTGYPKTHDMSGTTLHVACPRILLAGGGDPEDLAFADFFPEDPALDLAVADEDKNTIELLKFDPGEGTWKPHATYDLGTPYGIAPLPLEDGRVAIVVGNRQKREIAFFEPRCPDQQGCIFEHSHSEPLFETPRSGRITSFAAAGLGTDGFLSTSLVEDRDEISRRPAVDVTFLQLPVSPQALALLGASEGGAQSTRLELGEENAPTPDGVLLVDLSSPTEDVPDGIPDLLIHEPAGVVSIVALALPLDPSRPPGAFRPLSGLSLPGELVDWEVIAVDQPDPVLLASTPAEARAMRLTRGGGVEPVWSLGSGDAIRQVAQAWRTKERAELSNAFVVLLTDREALACTLGGPKTAPTSLFKAAEGAAAQSVYLRAVGVADLNHDGHDDVGLADALSTSLYVFLGRPGDDLAFDPPWAAPYPGPPESVALTFLDANGDTVLDAALGARDGTVLFFTGEGGGRFAGPEVLLAGPELESLLGFDLTGDGREEIIAATGVPGLTVISTRAPSSRDLGAR